MDDGRDDRAGEDAVREGNKVYKRGEYQDGV